MPEEKTMSESLHLNEEELTDKFLEIVAKSGQATAKYNFLPWDTIMALEELAPYYPGLRWILRKQRGDRYELRVFSSKHLEEWVVKGEP